MRPRGRVLVWLAIAFASLVSLRALSGVAEEVLEPETVAFDEAVREFVRARRTPALDRVLPIVTATGSSAVLVPVALLIAALLWRPGRRRIAALIVTVPAVAAGSFVALKALFERPRPEGAVMWELTTHAFPSGHATVSTAVAVSVCYVLARERILPVGVAAPVASVFPVLIAFTRVYLDVHWATDVIAGWLLGVALAAGAAAAYEWRLSRARAA